MQAEAEDRGADAYELFQQAWESAQDDYEACVAAHYLARHQPTPQETLRWNQECLTRADRVADERVKGFYVSLHLNMAQAYRNLEASDRAREHFELAAGHVHELPPGQYADWTRFAVADGLRSTGAVSLRAADDLLADLLAAFCARKDFKALGLILPVRMGDLGTEEDRLRLLTALRMIHAARWLPDDEQRLLARTLAELTTDDRTGVSS